MVTDLETPIRTLLSEMGLDLYDVELSGGMLRVTLTRPGGVDLDSLAEASRAISAWLDRADPISGHYTLDVSSPGLERQLRRPEHFASAIGEQVTLRERREGEPTRRLEGVLVACDETSATLEVGSERVTVSLEGVERARTVFTWGPTATSKKG